MKKVTYTLKEVCAWSRLEGQVEHRYVEVATPSTDPGSPYRVQTLELPTTEAVALCAAMATDDTLNHLIVSTPGGWMSSQGDMALPGVMSTLVRCIREGILRYPRYVTLRVCTQTGKWKFVHQDGDDAPTNSVMLRILGFNQIFISRRVPVHTVEERVCGKCKSNLMADDLTAFHVSYGQICTDCADDEAIEGL